MLLTAVPYIRVYQRRVVSGCLRYTHLIIGINGREVFEDRSERTESIFGLLCDANENGSNPECRTPSGSLRL